MKEEFIKNKIKELREIPKYAKSKTLRFLAEKMWDEQKVEEPKKVFVSKKKKNKEYGEYNEA